MIETTYAERSVSMTKQARRVLAEEAGRRWLKALNARDNAKECFVVMVNAVREAGLKLIQASDHEQLIFNADGMDFCRRELLPHLPVGMDLKAVQACVKLANALPKPIERPEELEEHRAELQLVMVTLELEDAPKRVGTLNPTQKNFASEWIRLGARAVGVFNSLKETIHVEELNREEILELVESWRPIKTEIERLEKMAAEKGNGDRITG